jgi:hypothetical protein
VEVERERVENRRGRVEKIRRKLKEEEGLENSTSKGMRVVTLI